MKDKLSCIVVEDELIYQKVLSSFIQEVDFLNLVGVFSSPIEAREQVKLDNIDIAFLDIITPGENGLEFAHSLKGSNCQIIFTTSKSEFAVHAYDIEACDYLLKPVEIDRFRKAVEKARSNYLVSIENNLTKFAELKHENILFFSKENGQIVVHHAHGVLQVKKSLKKLMEDLSDDRFVRIHKSFGVNVEAVTKVLKDKLHVGNEILPLSRQGKLLLMKKMEIF